jgi:hypothetical protein
MRLPGKDMRIHDGSLTAMQSKPEANGKPPSLSLSGRGRRACLARGCGFVSYFRSQTGHSLQMFRIPLTLHRDFRGCAVDVSQIL